MGDQSPLALGQHFKLLFNHLNYVGIAFHLSMQLEGVFNVFVDFGQVSIDPIADRKKIVAFDSKGLLEIYFNFFHVTGAKENFGHVVNNRLLDFFGPEAFDLALDGFTHNLFVTIIAVDSDRAVGSLTNQCPIAFAAADDAGQEIELRRAFTESGAFLRFVFGKELLHSIEGLLVNDCGPGSLYHLVSLPRFQEFLVLQFSALVHFPKSRIGEIGEDVANGVNGPPTFKRMTVLSTFSDLGLDGRTT